LSLQHHDGWLVALKKGLNQPTEEWLVDCCRHCSDPNEGFPTCGL